MCVLLDHLVLGQLVDREVSAAEIGLLDHRGQGRLPSDVSGQIAPATPPVCQKTASNTRSRGRASSGPSRESTGAVLTWGRGIHDYLSSTSAGAQNSSVASTNPCPSLSSTWSRPSTSWSMPALSVRSRWAGRHPAEADLGSEPLTIAYTVQAARFAHAV